MALAGHIDEENVCIGLRCSVTGTEVFVLVFTLPAGVWANAASVPRSKQPVVRAVKTTRFVDMVSHLRIKFVANPLSDDMT